MRTIFLKSGERLISSFSPRFPKKGIYGEISSNLIIIKKNPVKYRQFVVKYGNDILGVYPSLRDAKRYALPSLFSLFPSTVSERTFIIYSK